MIKGDWTISFLWRPESSWREIHGTLPIATVRLLDNSYATLYYEATYDVSDNRTGGKFVLTDGVNTITITADAGWLFADVLKFAIVHEDGVGVTLHVETPAEGTLDESDGLMGFTDYLHFVQFSANADGEVKGLGAYGDVKFYDSNLSAADVQKIFDLDPTAPTATLTQRAGQMIFARDSAAFVTKNRMGSGLYVQAKTTDQPRLSQTVVSTRPDLTLLDSAGRIAYAVGGDKIYLYSGPVLYSTTDGLTFDIVFDFSTHPEYPDPAPPNSNIFSYTVTDSGALLVRVGMEMGPQAAGSMIFRCPAGSDPTQAASWSVVCEPEVGGPMYFSWCGKRGAEIAFVCYGTKRLAGAETQPIPSAVYYSDDDGVTWGKIFEANETTYARWFNRGLDEAGWGLHGHTTVFHPSTTDTLFVVYGDRPMSGIVRLDYVGSGDKKLADNWTQHPDSPIYYAEPTSAIAYKGYIYFGLDATYAESSVFRMNPDTHEFESLIAPGHPRWQESTKLYYLSTNTCWVFSLFESDGVLYAGAFDQGQKTFGGLYATTNGTHWVQVVSAQGDEGLRFLAGRVGDYLWGWYRDAAANEKLFKVAVPRFRLATIVPASLPITSDHSQSDYSDPAVWSIAGQTNIVDAESNPLQPILSQSDDELFYGQSLKIAFPPGIAGGNRIEIRTTTGVNETSLQDGEKVLLGYHYKIMPRSAYLVRPHIGTMVSVSGDAELIVPIGQMGLAKSSPEKGWQRVWYWATARVGDGGAITAVRIVVRLDVTDAIRAGHNLDDVVAYIGGLFMIRLPDIHYSARDYVPASIPRAAEILIAPAYDVGRGGVEMAGFIGCRGFIG